MSSLRPVQRIGIIQRVLPTYRRPFFEKLAAAYPDVSICLFVGQPMSDEGLKTESSLRDVEVFPAVNRYWRGPGGMLCWQSGLRTWLHSFDPNVIVLEANPRILSHWLALKWMHRRGRPVLGWGLGELDRSGHWWLRELRDKFSRTLICSFDGIIAYSTKAKRDYIAAGLPPERIFVAHNSIDNRESEEYLARLGIDKTWIRPWKRSLGLDSQLPIVMFVGRLIPQKRVDLIIAACANLLDRCQVLIVGDGPLQEELEQQSSVYGDRVHFAGYQTGEALARFFIASDIFVLPGAGGLALHQAMSYGKPIVVSFGDGTEADLVREHKNGFFFRSNDVEDLRLKITQFLEKPELVRQMGDASLRIIRTEVNLDAMATSFLEAVMATSKNVEMHRASG